VIAHMINTFSLIFNEHKLHDAARSMKLDDCSLRANVRDRINRCSIRLSET